MRIGILFGGPSHECGISLTTARSIVDHLKPFGWEIIPFYCDSNKNYYLVPESFVYYNTPDDFEYKLKESSKKLTFGEERGGRKRYSDFIDECLKTDIVFPAIHGKYGEGGELQTFLEENSIRFIGSPSNACRRMFDKSIAWEYMKRKGFDTIPKICTIASRDYILDIGNIEKTIKDYFDEINANSYIVKPATNGSSIGVREVKGVNDAQEAIQEIFENGFGDYAIIEPYQHARQFTIIVLQNDNGEPVALLPNEIKLNEGNIYTHETKYHPNAKVKVSCPPDKRYKVDAEEIEVIQRQAEKLFKIFEMRDFARIDGWLTPDHKVIFSDINPISGLEQNSHLFLQGNRIGLSHSQILQYIVTHACRRYGIKCLPHPIVKYRPQKVKVLFGGTTSEREVSMMSGLNVWLKLHYTSEYIPEAYLLAPKKYVWKIPQTYVLNKSTEGLLETCIDSDAITTQLRHLVPPLRARLGLPMLSDDEYVQPRRMSLDQFCEEAVEEDAFVFIALHGGYGENGELQKKLNEYRLKYNGSDIDASKICMDKWRTHTELTRIVTENKDLPLEILPKIIVASNEGLVSILADSIWDNSCKIYKSWGGIEENVQEIESANPIERQKPELKLDHYKSIVMKNINKIKNKIYSNDENQGGTEQISGQEQGNMPEKFIDVIIKPIGDGSSTGIVRLRRKKTLIEYLECIKKMEVSIHDPDDLYIDETIRMLSVCSYLIENNQAKEYNVKEVELAITDNLIIEPYVKVEKLVIDHGDLKPEVIKGWIELTVGVLQKTNGDLHALTPSITIKEDKETILSPQDKSQSGRGVNITLPPEKWITRTQLNDIKTTIEKVATELKIRGYGRIDIFFNTLTNKICIIEANTLPSLIPSTVLFHQALAEENQINPQKLLSRIIELGNENSNGCN